MNRDKIFLLVSTFIILLSIVGNISYSISNSSFHLGGDDDGDDDHDDDHGEDHGDEGHEREDEDHREDDHDDDD